MAKLTETPARLEIHQSRKWLWIVMWFFAIDCLLGTLIFVWLGLHPHSPHVVIACDRGKGSCLVTTDGSEQNLPIASITGASVAGNELFLYRSQQEPYRLCQAPPAELADAAKQLAQFFGSPTTTSINATCDSTLINTSPKPIFALLMPLGLALVLAIFGGWYGISAHTIIDRDTKTIKLRGYRWPRKRWNLERPISQAQVVTRPIYTSVYNVYIRLDDGALINVMGPCSRSGRLSDKIATISRHLREADHHDPEKHITEPEHQRHVGAVGQPPQSFDAPMAAGRHSGPYHRRGGHPWQGSPQDSGAPVGVWPQPAPPEQPGFARRAGARRRLLLLLLRLAQWLVLITLCWWALSWVGAIAYDAYAYRVGTPTTATVDNCVHHNRDINCTAVWSIGGNSYTGPIVPIVGTGYDHAEGSSLDVRVHRGRAYQNDMKGNAVYLLIPGFGIPIALWLIRVWRSRKKTARSLADRTGSQ
jgi:hypothetical protein